ncbi:MAG TPA: transporter substrate-binding domain-containing protein, partial [Acidimicrobiia bacterium]|nr:transporter substrate-binding domain-containing protein [Acidimicrobiia bacterium]
MRLRKWMFLLVVLAMVAAACGDDDDAGDTTAATQATTTTMQATTTTEGQPFATKTPGVLTVGSDIPFPPFEDFDDGGDVVGFDADLINELASRLGLTVTWIDTDFDTIFTQLALGQFDVVASATTITPERAQQVDFTSPYYKAQQALTVNENETPNLIAWEDLRERDSVAVQTGTTGADWAIENLAPNGVDVREFPAAPDTYNALEAGQVTGVIFDEPSAVEESANRPGLKVVQVIDTNEDYGFGVDPNAEGLLGALNAEFAAMLSDGTYQAIYDTWFDAPAGSVLYEGDGAVAGGPTIPEGWPRELVFGFVPSRESETLQDNVDVFAQVLADALGIDVTGVVTTDYTALGIALGTGEADMGAFGPAGFVLANRAYPEGLELLAQSVRFGDSTYHAQWFTNDPSICTGDPVEGAFYYDDDGNVVAVGPTDSPALQVGWNGDGTRDDTVSAGLRCPEPVDI